jgi:hypothetical protein
MPNTEAVPDGRPYGKTRNADCGLKRRRSVPDRPTFPHLLLVQICISPAPRLAQA